MHMQGKRKAGLWRLMHLLYLKISMVQQYDVYCGTDKGIANGGPSLLAGAQDIRLRA